MSRSLADYEILSQAGSGGMGVVFRAVQRSLGRLVALKVIRQEISADAAYRERFMREARLVASIDHPHVVSIFDIGEDEGSLFLAMQWIEGSDLTRMVERLGRLPPDRAVAITTQVATALDAVHGMAGLVHRDVKPANVLVRELAGSDHAYLTDFGVARPSHGIDHLTHPDAIVGTSGYLAPEQIRGGEPSSRSDLYALGCVFFEALTGVSPFVADNELALRWAHASAPRPRPSATLSGLGFRYDEFFDVALAIDPAQRFASGQAFANALHAVQTTGDIDDVSAVLAADDLAPVATQLPGPVLPFAQSAPPPAFVYASSAADDDSSSAMLIALAVLALLVLLGIVFGILVATGAFSGGGGSAHIVTTNGS